MDIANFITSLLNVDFDPVGLVTDPLTGNWNSLDQKGQVLAIAGDAAETIAENLTDALPTLFGQWEGGAADSFDSYLHALTAALRYAWPRVGMPNPPEPTWLQGPPGRPRVGREF